MNPRIVFYAIVAIVLAVAVIALLVIGDLGAGASYLVYVVAGAALVLASLWQIPRLQRKSWESRAGWVAVPLKDRIELEDNARKTVAQVISGIGLVATLAVTLLQVSSSRDASRDTLDQARQSQADARFAQAITGLGARDGNNRPALETRVGAMYALGRHAAEGYDQRQEVTNILTAYLRTHPSTTSADATQDEPCAAGGRGVPADVAAALDVLRSFYVIGVSDGTSALDLSGAQLAGGDMVSLDISEADLTGADISGAFLASADLTNVFLARVKGRGVCLSGAILRDASSQAGSREEGPDLRGADLTEADLRGATLSYVDLRGALIDGAKLERTQLDHARLKGARFSRLETDRRTRECMEHAARTGDRGTDCPFP
jgi:Pentapeptide repeats (8 copies)